MPVPSPIKITKKGVEYVSAVDRAAYTLRELERAALRDIGKLIRRRVMQKARLQPGLRKGKRISNAFQYWVRKRETDLQVGIKHNTWYGAEQEIGSSKQRKKALLTDTVYENIDEIRRIAGAYIKEIEDENRALALINEEEAVGEVGEDE